MAYYDAMLCAVRDADRDAYRAHAEAAAAVFRDHGALAVFEGWGDDVPEGKLNSMRSAVLLGEGESVVLSWIRWPSRGARDAGWAGVMQDARMKPGDMPFDGARLIHGGFETLLEG
jgi:uncharacterized protein YbaA (DUF1428 family)